MLIVVLDLRWREGRNIHDYEHPGGVLVGVSFIHDWWNDSGFIFIY